MKVTIVNCPDRDFKPYVKDAVEFYAEQLIPDGRIRNVCTTKVRFNSKIEEYGFASVQSFNSKNQPRKFLIEIHPGIGVRAILETLAHEMVHVKQYITGETNDELSKWHGRKINSDAVDYWDHPWEIDAYGREPGLTYKFICKNQLWDVFPDYRNPSIPIVSVPIKWK
jgi:hypothetical protein